MKEVAYNKFEKNFKEYIVRASEGEALLIEGEPNKKIVMISEENYASIMETMFLLAQGVDSVELEDRIRNFSVG